MCSYQFDSNMSSILGQYFIRFQNKELILSMVSRKCPTHPDQSDSHLFNKGQQRLAVFLPLQWKFTFMRKLVTPQEDGQLKTVGVQVAEVIHTCGQR